MYKGKIMQFTWDDGKSHGNKRKHQVDFETAARVFLDPNRLEYYDTEHAGKEERWITIGLVDPLVLLVAYTERGKTIRIISARRANKNEQKEYYKIQSRT